MMTKYLITLSLAGGGGLPLQTSSDVTGGALSRAFIFFLSARGLEIHRLLYPLIVTATFVLYAIYKCNRL